MFCFVSCFVIVVVSFTFVFFHTVSFYPVVNSNIMGVTNNSLLASKVRHYLFTFLSSLSEYSHYVCRLTFFIVFIFSLVFFSLFAQFRTSLALPSDLFTWPGDEEITVTRKEDRGV